MSRHQDRPQKSKPKEKERLKADPKKAKETKEEIRARVVAAFRAAFAHEGK